MLMWLFSLFWGGGDETEFFVVRYSLHNTYALILIIFSGFEIVSPSEYEL